MTIRDNRDYIRVLLYSHYTTNAGWGVLRRYRAEGDLWAKGMQKNMETTC